MLRKLKRYGFYVYIDPHQDLWSRFAGGSGAPLWTIHACGLQPRSFQSTQAAFIHNQWSEGPSQFPDMLWATNYHRLACYTIFTLFFGGKTFAPKCIIDGLNIQDYLQYHYFNAHKELLIAINKAGDLEDCCVLGWDSMNEPSLGLIGYKCLSKLYDNQKVKIDTCPTPHECFQLGNGMGTKCQSWKFTTLGPQRMKDVIIDPRGQSAWLQEEDEPNGKSKWGWQRSPQWELGRCIWAQHGVWDDESRKLIKPDYFNKNEDVLEIYWKKFIIDWATLIRKIHKKSILWIAPPVFEKPCSFNEKVLGERAVLSHHYYDGLTLMTKKWHWFNADALGLLRNAYKTVLCALKFGERSIRQSLQSQLSTLKSDSYLLSEDNVNLYPMMIGEIGIPFDMKLKKKQSKKDNYRLSINRHYKEQMKALDCSLNSCDGSNCLSYTIWSYVDHNNHEWGDGWNGEDLSIWSKDDKHSIDNYYNNSKNNDFNYGDSNSLIPLMGSLRTASNSSSSITNSQLSSDNSSGSNNNKFKLIDGCRAPQSFIRPYIEYSNGKVIYMDYDIKLKKFTGKISLSKSTVNRIIDKPTEIFIPRALFMNPIVKVTKGDYIIDNNRLTWIYDFNNDDIDQIIQVTVIDMSTINQEEVYHSKSIISKFKDALTSFIKSLFT